MPVIGALEYESPQCTDICGHPVGRGARSDTRQSSDIAAVICGSESIHLQGNGVHCTWRSGCESFQRSLDGLVGQSLSAACRLFVDVHGLTGLPCNTIMKSTGVHQGDGEVEECRLGGQAGLHEKLSLCSGLLCGTPCPCITRRRRHFSTFYTGDPVA